MKFIEFEEEIIRVDIVTNVTKLEAYPIEENPDYYTWRVYSRDDLIFEGIYLEKEEAIQKRDKLKEILLNLN